MEPVNSRPGPVLFKNRPPAVHSRHVLPGWSRCAYPLEHVKVSDRHIRNFRYAGLSLYPQSRYRMVYPFIYQVGATGWYYGTPEPAGSVSDNPNES